MEFSEEQKRFINKYVEVIENGSAAIFAGAGLSNSSGFVNWKGLLKDLAEEINLSVDKEHDLVMVAQYHHNKYKRAKINEKIINEFTTLKEGSENHKILARIGIDTFWTTNYDQFIERTLEAQGKTPDKKVRNADFSRTFKKKDAVVYKMHGDKDSPDEAVLTKDDYDTYNDKRELFTIALRGDLVSRTFLFLGFSFDDPNLEYILTRIKILLKDNVPHHHCIFKRVAEKDYNTPKKTKEQNQEDFLYAKIKQELKIEDLRRYGIHAVVIDEYDDITLLLKEIERRLKRKNIFISGAASEFTPYSQDEALNFLHSLGFELAKKEYKIVSGLGLGIGTTIINGALDYKLNSKYRNLDDLLLLRPFPQYTPPKSDLETLKKVYREEMIGKAGIGIFLFGNRQEKGHTVLADGVRQEFSICLQMGVIPIPVGATEYVSRELWKEVTSNLTAYYPNVQDLHKAVVELGGDKVTKEDIIKNILIIISILQKS